MPSRAASLSLLLTINILSGLAPTGSAIPVPGSVLERDSGTPIPGARVRVQTAPTHVVTDASGGFVIDLEVGVPVNVVAAKEGYYNGGLDGGFYTPQDPPAPAILILDPIPAEPVLENPFNHPSEGLSCGFCHASFYSQWFGSGEDRPSRHSTAGQNTWVRDLYDGSGTGGGLAQPGYVFKRDSTSVAAGSPYTTGLCAECHLPMLTSLIPEGTSPENRTELADATADSPQGSLERLAHDFGVSCDVCHKMEKVEQDNGKLGRTAFFGKAKLRATATDLQYGPLDDVTARTANLMRASYNPLHTQSLVCAPCHEYNMDHDFDGDFDDEGSPPGQTTYSEWLGSAYAEEGITCQNCHMPPAENPDSLGFGGPVREATQIHNHAFEGTTLPFLQAATNLVLAASRVNNELRARVEVRNIGAGHNFPTGFTTRNVILAVTATTNIGEPVSWVPNGTDLVPDWGGVGPDENDYGNRPGRGFARVLYGRGDVEGTTKERVVFIDALGEASNTTIPPGGLDRSRYVFDLNTAQGQLAIVEAKLVYRRMWKDVVEIKGWTLDAQGYPYGDVLAHTATAEVVIASPTVDIFPNGQVDPFDLHAFLEDRSGVRNHLTDFDGANGEDIRDLFYLARRWYGAP
ncbi:MAG: hypothetical protein GHCLOJNM_01968 [bacterium]|nr:hypothetical protein [bacterium]